jgi:hypothetical protein
MVRPQMRDRMEHDVHQATELGRQIAAIRRESGKGNPTDPRLIEPKSVLSRGQ